MTDFSPGTVVVGYLDPGTWSACFGLSYRDLLLYDLGVNQRIMRPGGMELRNLTGSGGIPAGRNKIAQKFLKTDAEWLFFVDTDMGFADDTVDRLVESAHSDERPVVGGLCFCLKKQDKESVADYLYGERFGVEPTVYEWVEIEDEAGVRSLRNYQDLADDHGLVKVAATGGACLLIHRSVLQDIESKYGPIWFNTITHPTGDKGEPRTFSEDLSFSIRVAAVGAPMYVNTSVKTTHEKGGIFLDEAEFIKQEQAKRS